MYRRLLLSLLLFAGLVLVPSPASAAPYCGISWGSLAKSVSSYSSAPVTNVRAGRHECFDRFVVDLRGPVPGYRVEYGAVSHDGSGQPVPLRGTDLRIVVHAPAHDSSYRPTFSPRNSSEVVDVSGYRTFRQVAYAGSFEGQTTFGLGVRARLPFRVMLLPGPGSASRVVVDVAHRW